MNSTQRWWGLSLWANGPLKAARSADMEKTHTAEPLKTELWEEEEWRGGEEVERRGNKAVRKGGTGGRKEGGREERKCDHLQVTTAPAAGRPLHPAPPPAGRASDLVTFILDLGLTPPLECL